MRASIIALALGVSAATNCGECHAAVMVVSTTNAAFSRQVVPMSMPVDLGKLLAARTKPESLYIVEQTGTKPGVESVVAAQFEAESSGSLRGRLWWLMPPSSARERRFMVKAGTGDAPAALAITADSLKRYYDIREGKLPVLRYNHGTVPVPPGVGTNYARGDYIMPLYGLGGEAQTDDYPKDHAHHRGISWSWPVTRWKNEVRDIWAVRGVWARPVAMRRAEVGSVFALLEAENVWKWGDTNAIVREEVLIRAFARSGKGRLVDIELRLTALADGVAIGGRPKHVYGGFGFRAQSAEQRVITLHTDPTECEPRRSWLDYTGVFKGGRGLAGLTIFEHVGNAGYPNTLLEYPKINYVMPAFPGDREVPLSKDKPLVLRHRLWIHERAASEREFADVWASYAQLPNVTLQN